MSHSALQRISWSLLFTAIFFGVFTIVDLVIGGAMNWSSNMRVSLLIGVSTFILWFMNDYLMRKNTNDMS
ncbi:hypothetical protein BCL52_2080 [Salisediminibacterium halotolerans]|nr:hypothetical protein BCL39_2083 [Actinophytocola xinjiangensis]RPE85405.1 hypothetical protein EDD67_2218 [Salisediminibacterium halotolerans]TWG33362.1 hypothetical protein BCL52_2080 [Salisediminibacterium halotolerans]GEL07110.1 hypothetical protein SHA02_05260 [Salisediminibacterium halotolerans]